MSGIYGMIRFDGGPVEQTTIANMREAMSYYGPDGGNQWCQGSVGLGHLLLRITPEDSFEVQPVRANEITVVAAARIDNRDELLCELGIALSEHSAIPDSQLILEAYLKWGDNSPDHLEGDWQFAAYNRATRKLFIARDQHGNTSMYYHKCRNFFVFASSQKALFTVPGVPKKPDMLKMAQILTAWSGEEWRSSHEEIFRLPPAHKMVIDTNGTKKIRYWFPENRPEIRRKNDNEYVEEFMQLYSRAVQVRLRSTKPVGVTLSGGLDSGSVAVLAAPMLKKAGKTLTAFTSVPLFEPSGAGKNRFGDEWELASATALMAGDNVDHIAVRSENFTVLEGIRRQLRILDSPVHGASNMYWLHDILEQSHDNGIGVLLTGQLGNGTVSFVGNGQCIQPLMRGEFKSAFQTLCHADISVLHAVKRQIIRPLLTPALRYCRENKGWDEQPWRGYSSINPDFAEKTDLLKRMKHTGHDPTFTFAASRCHQRFILNLGKCIAGSIWHEMGAGYALDIRDPTSDNRLIEFCLKIPDSQYYWRGENKRLIRSGFNGIIPTEVLYNSKVGLQGADISHRVQNERIQLFSVLNQLRSDQTVNEIIDLQSLENLLKSSTTIDNEESNFKCGTILLRGLMVGMFVAEH